jgi:choline dehydrogenase-like flavoprotein
MTIRPNSIVHELIYDDSKRCATGVRVIDAETHEHLEFTAKVIFLCASTFGSAFIMLNSVSPRFPHGFGNDSGELGCNIMDHHLDVGATALEEGFADRYYLGNRPNDLYIPRYRNLGGEQRDYIRGFGYQGNASRLGWTRLLADSTFGGALKTEGATPGPWYVKLGGFGEILPNHANRVTLDKTRKDKWGLPLLAFDAQLRENELKMRKEMASDAAEMLEAAGFTEVRTYDREIGVGLGIHEMGTARMGKDPKTSVLNKWNQVHACPNVYVTDGSFMASSACQNPSLTYMAMTARAVDHAVGELKRMSI